jgi:hypothetical protein
MTNKSELLSQISQAIEEKLITREEVLELFPKEDQLKAKPTSSRFHFGKIISFLGGFIVFLGISFLVSLIWVYLNHTGQILVTLGTGLVAYIVGNLLLFALPQNRFLGSSVHLIGGLLIPTGIFVWLSKLGQSPISLQLLIAMIFAGLAVTYLASDYFLKSNVLNIFTVIFATIAFYSLFFWLTKERLVMFRVEELWSWSTVVVGLSYLGIGYALKNTSRAVSGNLWWSVGITIFLPGVWAVSIVSIHNILSEILFLLILIAVLYLSSYFRSLSFLVVGTIYLIVFILYLTSVYFAEVLTWPVALILVGLAMIGVGYLVVNLSQKIRTKPTKTS